MMRSALILLIASFVTAHTASAADNLSGAPAVNNATHSPEYVAGACHFRIANMFGGHFSADSKESPPMGVYYLPEEGPLMSPILSSFGIFCVDSDTANIAMLLGTKHVNGQWLRYDPSGSWGAPLAPFDQQQHAKVITLTGKNWSGTGVSIDDTTGDERQRLRTFYFCAIHDTHALCGKAPIESLSKPKVNELAKVKAILNSVEFVDDAVSTSTQPSNNGASVK